MRVLLLWAMATAIAVGPAFGQSNATRFGEGTDYFRYILKQNGAVAIREADALLDKPPSTALVVFGRTEILDDLLRDQILLKFLEADGRVLIATDRRTTDGLFDGLGFQITGETWEMPDGFPQVIYRGSLDQCPLVLDYGRFRSNRPSAPFFQGAVTDTGNPISKIATNLPSNIGRSRLFRPIATLSRPRHRLRLFPDGSVDNQVLLAALSSRWNKNLLVLADHSIFINEMVCQVDNDNAPFANNIVNWLMDAGNGQRRTSVLFYDDGHIQTNFDVSLTVPPPISLPLEAIVPLADEAIVALERDNVFNAMLLDATGGPRPILRFAALFLTGALLLFGLYRFVKSRYRAETRVPRLPARLDALTAAVPAVERRHQAVIAQGNLAEAARELAHQAFASVGLTPSPDARTPAVSVTGWCPPLRAHRWTRVVHTMWTLAARGPAHRVSPAALQKLDATLHGLIAAVAAGEVRLAAAESPI